ncbi:hypothetical protein BG015_001497 [Linnemannia schmuckeri]|uniref:F-box domain-containing protein n=1 Tax=Linnemannia schmuckeri TaxID=64567 RepID=A0A9P5RPX6_9FUNG|nr:hypothetical protein BG015_001497 [Linnemannia schmuckeri]
MAGILDLPEEIRPFIGKFLDTKAIQACLLVNRSFRRSFEPILWQKVVIRSLKSNAISEKNHVFVDVSALRTRTLDVHNYVIHDSVASEFYQLSFPHLRRLQLTDEGLNLSSRTAKNKDNDFLTRKYQRQVTDQTQLIRLNPTTRTLIIASLAATPDAEFWETIYSTWVNPQILHATGPVAWTEEAANAFWKACTRFSELSLLSLTIESSPILSTLTFPRVRHLNLQTPSIVQSRWLKPQDHLVLMKACPQLKHLTWDATALSPSQTFAPALLSEFRQAIEQNHWPYLDSLEFCRLYNKLGKELVLLLQAFPNPLTALRLKNCTFNSRVLTVLKDKKFESLKILKIYANCGITSKATLDILTSCPNIEVFRSTHIYAGDIDPSKPWVCKRLRSLTVCFIHRETASNRAVLDLQVYAQLAKMTDLTRLDLGQYSMGYTTSDPEFHLMDAMNTLDLRLKAGLGQLSTLTKLRFFGYANSFQVTGQAEILWMMENWKELRTLIGQLDGIERSALRAMEARGVEYRLCGRNI